MAIPRQAKQGEVWLGTVATAPTERGWFRVAGQVQPQLLPVFDTPVHFGPANAAAQDVISADIQDSWAGGIGILDRKEASDVERVWWGVADIRFPGHATLPPLVRAIRPAGVAAALPVYPLGQLNDAYYLAFGSDAYGYKEVDATWYGLNPLTHAPVGKAVLYDGRLIVPCGANGYKTLSESAPGTLTVTARGASIATPANASATTNPSAVCFAVYNNQLWAITTAGCLAKSIDPQTNNKWKWLWDPVLDVPVKVMGRGTGKRLQPYFNRAGEPALYVVATDGAYLVNEAAMRLESTPIQLPNHPDVGLCSEVFGPGEDLYVGAGMDLIDYTSANVVVPQRGLCRDDGVPAQYRGKIVDLQAEQSFLYALVQGNPAASNPETSADDRGANRDDPTYLPVPQASSFLGAWTRTAWVALWEGTPDQGIPTWMGLGAVSSSGGSPVDGYRLWWGLGDGYAYTTKLRRTFHNPRQGQEAGVDEFAPTGYLLLSRFDADMPSFQKLAAEACLRLESASATESVTVEYQTDADAATTWHPLGAATAKGLTTLPFFARPGDADGAGRPFSSGVAFDWIAVRLTLARGADVRRTPVLKSFVLDFVKVPKPTESFAFSVVLAKPGEKGRDVAGMFRYLRGLAKAPEMVALVHGNATYRGRIARVLRSEVAGPDGTGEAAAAITFVQIASDGLDAS